MNGANCERADFAEADMELVSAVETNFSGAQFDRAKAAQVGPSRSALFLDAGGEDVSFAEAKLIKVDLRTAQFDRANFRGADLSKAVLRRAEPEALLVFGRASSRRRDASEAQAEGVDFSRADLSFGNFRQANLKRANLSHILAFEADLSGTLLIGANFDGREPRGRGPAILARHRRGLQRSAPQRRRPRQLRPLRGEVPEDQLLGRFRAEGEDVGSLAKLLGLSTMFSKAKEKKGEVEDVKEKARQKRIEDLATQAEKRPPHASGKR